MGPRRVQRGRHDDLQHSSSGTLETETVKTETAENAKYAEKVFLGVPCVLRG
jgi:hypothetical protein